MVHFNRRAWELECPEILKYWDYVKNEKKPEETNKMEPVWWTCEKGHSYEISPLKMLRSGKKKCLLCPPISRALHEKNNLLALNPPYMSSWDFVKNEGVDYSKLTPGSNLKVWWICEKGHSFFQNIRERKRRNCPFCAGKKPSKENNLSLHPCAKEFHPTKNHPNTPLDFTRGSGKKVWWLCPQGHEYITTVESRTISKSNCPYCQRTSSQIEIRIYAELKALFKDTLWQKKIENQECDILIPSLMIAIEVDGSYWHKEKIQKDIRKNEVLQKNHYLPIRLREHPLPLLSPYDISYDAPYDYLKIIKEVLLLIHTLKGVNVSEYLKNSVFINETLFKKLSSEMLKPKKSIVEVFPGIKKIWHPTKNLPLLPENFSYGSCKKAWFICEKGHEYFSRIESKRKGCGCPFCHPSNVTKYTPPNI